MISCTYKKVVFSKCNGPSCNLVTKNETVRIKKIETRQGVNYDTDIIIHSYI